MLAPDSTEDSLDTDAAVVTDTADTGAAAEAPRQQRLYRRLGGIGTISSLGWIGLVVVLAAIADFLPIDDPEIADFTAIGRGPSSNHLLGTDEIGRDILSRVIFGARISLLVGVVSVILGMFVGGLLGLLAGYLRGWTERVVMVLTDSLLAFPALILLLCLAAVFGTNLPTLIVGLAILTVPTFIRLTRANSLVVSKREYVMAAKAYGSGTMRVILRDVVPNVTMPILAYSFIIMGVVIVAEGSLSFLGLGIPGPTPSWGSMIAGGRRDLADKPHIAMIPSAIMFVTVLAFTLVGERYRQRFDKRVGAL